MMRKVAAAVLIVMLAPALGGCGQTAELRPKPGHQLPVAPYGRGDQPTASTLLVPQPQASPERSVELRSRSENRQDDPFDLPPAG